MLCSFEDCCACGCTSCLTVHRLLHLCSGPPTDYAEVYLKQDGQKGLTGTLLPCLCSPLQAIWQPLNCSPASSSQAGACVPTYSHASSKKRPGSTTSPHVPRLSRSALCVPAITAPYAEAPRECTFTSTTQTHLLRRLHAILQPRLMQKRLGSTISHQPPRLTRFCACMPSCSHALCRQRQGALLNLSRPDSPAFTSPAVAHPQTAQPHPGSLPALGRSLKSQGPGLV